MIAAIRTTTYTLTATLTNCEASPALPNSISTNDTVSTVLGPLSGAYTYPNSVEVTNALYTYSSSTGSLTISGARGNVTVAAQGARYKISQIQTPDSKVYEIKDAWARDQISIIRSAGISFYRCSSSSDTPIGVTWTDGTSTYTGTLQAVNANKNYIYLVPSSRVIARDIFTEYAVVKDSNDNYTWEKLGDTDIDLSSLGELAYLNKSDVVLHKGSGDTVLGESTTFTNGSSSVTFTGNSTQKYVEDLSVTKLKLVVDTTNGIKVNNSTSKTFATQDASDTNVSYVGSSSTTNVLDAATVANGTETLTISNVGVTQGAVRGAGGTGTVTDYVFGTLNVATGAVAANGTGDDIVTAVTSTGRSDAITTLGTGTAAAQTITVGTNDKVSVAKYGDISLTIDGTEVSTT